MPKTKEIYLDVCVLSRPFDDQNSLRIHLETDAFYLIMKHVHAGHYIFLYSAVHMAEIEAIPDVLERNFLQVLLAKSGQKIKPKNKSFLWERSEVLIQTGLGVADAAHLTFAESIKAYGLISCDDNFVKKAAKITTTVPVINPIQFVQEEDLI